MTQNADDFGMLEHEGIMIMMTQNPYIDKKNNEESAYYATAVDNDDNKYEVRWEITNTDYLNPENIVEECEMCNWDNFTVREL